MPRPGRRPGRRGGTVTSGWGSGFLLVDGEALPLFFGGSSRPPVSPPIRPSLWLPEAEPLGLPLLDWLPEAEPAPVPGGVDRCVPEPLGGVREPCRLPSPDRAGCCGSRDCSGATSSSMASNTEETCLL